MKSLQTHWQRTQLEAVGEAVNYDDIALYRLFGFALFVSISYRNNVVYRNLHKSITQARKKRFMNELIVLKALLETDKTVLPLTIKFQDRGKMSFPHSAMLPFCRHCLLKIKSQISREKYAVLRSRIMIVSTTMFATLFFAVVVNPYISYPLRKPERQ